MGGVTCPGAETTETAAAVGSWVETPGGRTKLRTIVLYNPVVLGGPDEFCVRVPPTKRAWLQPPNGSIWCGARRKSAPRPRVGIATSLAGSVMVFPDSEQKQLQRLVAGAIAMAPWQVRLYQCIDTDKVHPNAPQALQKNAFFTSWQVIDVQI